MKTKTLLSVAFIAFGLYNTIVLYNAFASGMAGTSYHTALASAAAPTPGGPDDPPGGLPDGPNDPLNPGDTLLPSEPGDGGGFSCTGRGGKEMPKKILRLDRCTIEIKISIGTTFETTIVKGAQCKCLDDPRGYVGDMGCDLTWETSCVESKVVHKT